MIERIYAAPGITSGHQNFSQQRCRDQTCTHSSTDISVNRSGKQYYPHSQTHERSEEHVRLKLCADGCAGPACLLCTEQKGLQGVSCCVQQNMARLFQATSNQVLDQRENLNCIQLSTIRISKETFVGRGCSCAPMQFVPSSEQPKGAMFIGI